MRRRRQRRSVISRLSLTAGTIRRTSTCACLVLGRRSRSSSSKLRMSLCSSWDSRPSATPALPLPDPYLAIAEILILVMAPIMVCLMLAIHQCAPKQAKPFTQVALGWMLAAAAFTTVVHFVQLTVARHIDSATFPGYAGIFGWQWLSTFYAIDIVAWDVFFGLALLFAVPAFAHRGDATLVRRGLILSGSLCLIGLVGPFANVLGLRTIGIVGYTVVFGLTCLPLSRTFNAETR